jgi:hypothetical protein
MRFQHAGLAAAFLAVAAHAVAAPARAAAPPKVLNIVRVKVKPRAAESYTQLEAQIVRAYERARVKLYWIGLQSIKDPSDVLYLNLYDSQEGPDRAAATYRDAMKQHPELPPLQQRLQALTLSTVSTLATRRDDVDRAVPDGDLPAMRRMRLTMIQVRPGREGDFLNAIRTTPPKDGSWLVYEANDSSTYALITPKRTALTRKDGPALPRALRRFRGVYSKAETRTYAVRIAISHLPKPPTRSTSGRGNGPRLP